MNKQITHRVTLRDGTEIFANIPSNQALPMAHVMSTIPIGCLDQPQEETFDWKTAMKLFAEGVEIESIETHEIFNLSHRWARFDEALHYRRKPVAPKPDYSKDQGFQCGDIVMVSDNRISWRCSIYESFDLSQKNEYPHITNISRYKYARPLTKSEYERVKVEGV